MNFTLPEWIHHLPAWLNLKVLLAVALVGGGLWLFFRTLGEVVKIVVALVLVGAGAFIILKVMGVI